MGDGAVNSEEQIRSVEEQIRRVEEKIERVDEQIERVDEQIIGCSSDEERNLLRSKKAQLRGEKAQLRDEKAQLRDEKAQLLGRVAQLRDEKAQIPQGRGLIIEDLKDRSGEWIKHMLLPLVLELPRNEFDLKNLLFPEVPGKLPVGREFYLRIFMEIPDVASEYLIEADYSMLPVALTGFLAAPFPRVTSEMLLSNFIGYIFTVLFSLLGLYSRLEFEYNLFFNCNKSTGDSISGSTEDKVRPDTLVTASGCTFLIGEDKVSSLTAAQQDLRCKIFQLSPMFYGNVECILGYAAGGPKFQWLCIDKYGMVKKAGDTLMLDTILGRSKFLLSIGYAYQLIKKMVDSVPDVPGRRAMFTQETVGDREIAFYPGYILKTIRNFQNFCDARKTQVDWILEAYKLGEKYHFLPKIRLVMGYHTSYRVEIRPIGFTPTLQTEQDTRMLAKNVCEALHVLHEAGFVHRDVRQPNILQVSKEQFMLIDLETVAKSPFLVPEGFERFNEWSDDPLVDGAYTPMSDLYQLGKILRYQVPYFTMSSTSAQQFIEMLQSKKCTAAMALNDPWLLNTMS